MSHMCSKGMYPVAHDRAAHLEIRALGAAVDGLAALVRAEYPDDLTLAEIAETWGPGEGLTARQIQAIRALPETLR
jgi:hypothetical protein